MKQRDILALMDGIAPGIAASFAKAIAPVLARLEVAEKRVSELEARPVPDIDPEIIAALVNGETKNQAVLFMQEVRDELKKLPAMPTIEEIVALVPIPKDGRDGVDGKDGEKGEKGDPGEAGANGLDGVDAKDGAAGMDGAKGIDGKDGRDGIDGEKGLDGKDGVGLAGMLIDRDGELVATLTDGTTKKLGPVVGKDGEVGLGYDEMFEEMGDDGRTLIRRYVRGDQTKEFKHTFAVVLDRGVFKDGTEYVPGDGVTFGGSFWIAQIKTQERPGTSDAWRLAVKKGRDGKDGRDLGPPPTLPKVKL